MSLEKEKFKIDRTKGKLYTTDKENLEKLDYELKQGLLCVKIGGNNGE